MKRSFKNSSCQNGAKRQILHTVWTLSWYRHVFQGSRTTPPGMTPTWQLPRRTTPPEDNSPGGWLPRRTTPAEDVSPAGHLPQRMTPPQDKCPVLSLLLLLLPPGESSSGGVVLRGSRQLGVVPGGVVLIRYSRCGMISQWGFQG